MATPAHIGKYTADNPGITTLQGTNQYVVGKESVVVIDVALSADSNLDGIIEQVEAMGAKKIEKILITHIHSDHTGANAFFAKQGAVIYAQENLRDEMLRQIERRFGG